MHTHQMSLFQTTCTCTLNGSISYHAFCILHHVDIKVILFFNSRANFSRKIPSLGKGIILLKFHLNLKKRGPEYACAIIFWTTSSSQEIVTLRKSNIGHLNTRKRVFHNKHI